MRPNFFHFFSKAQYGGAIESARTGYFDSGYSDANSLGGAAPNGINASGVSAGANGIYGAYGPYGIYGAGGRGGMDWTTKITSAKK